MTRRRRLGWIGAAAVVGIGIGLASFPADVLARQGVVKMKDGRALEGDIEEGAGEVAIKIRGIPTKLDPANVASVDYFDSVDARYKERVAKLPPNAPAKDHLDIARWLLDVRSYDNALREVDAARRLDPNSADAITLEQTIMSQRRLSRPPAVGGPAVPPPVGPRPPVNGAAAGKPATPHAKDYLTADDINIIRQMEWKESDPTAPRVTVPAAVRNRYVTMKALDATQFAALNPKQQAYLILSDRDTPAELRRDIKVTTDPVNLTEFKRTIQPLIISNCATVGCHGGPGGGKFHLFHNNTDRDDVTYTNFYILRQYTQAVGDKTYQMIDPQFENLSILGQFALHPDAAELDHPEIKGQALKPMANNKTSPNYLKLMAWMKNLVAGQPKYGITYEVPGTKPAADKPAAPPATPAPAPAR
ncbi:MAG: hypothetical protein ACAI43_05930 [Phycisphaerae bacterium]